MDIPTPFDLDLKDARMILKQKDQLLKRGRAKAMGSNKRGADDRRHLGSQALREAQKAVLSAHQEEFDQALGDAREKYGLPRVPGPRKKLSRIEQLRQQLRDANIEPVV